MILDSGLGDSYISWHKVQPQIAQFTRVCSYDRAGLGYSDSSPRSPHQQSVRRRIAQRFCKTPASLRRYVLVGHSMGGFDVRLYASLYRNEVAGMVLVDSSHPEQQKRFPPALNDMDATWLREQEFLEFTMPFGIPRLLGFCGNDGEVRAAECNFHSRARKRRRIESDLRKRRPNCQQRLTRRYASRRSLPRSRSCPNPTCPKTW